MILKNRIKKIIDAIKDTEINEIEISSFWGAQKIKMKKNNSSEFVVEKNIVKEDKSNKTDDTSNLELKNETIHKNIEKIHAIEEDDIQDTLTIIKAPLVGTFYLSPKPGDPPFVENNSTIIKGTTLCIVEAMKIFNEIESDYDGIIKEILVNDGEPIEYDQPLFKIEEK